MSRRFNTNKFLKDVFNDRYALVIGNEIILDTKIESIGDVHQYLLRKVNENSNVQYENYNEIAFDKNDKELMAMLETLIFTTVLTTADGSLEAALRKVWGNDLCVVNIYDKETVDELQKALKASCRGEKQSANIDLHLWQAGCGRPRQEIH